MRILIQIVAYLLIAVIALFAAGEFFGLRRFRSFTVPYTDKLREDRLNHGAGLAISVLVCAMMARFLAWPTGVAAFALAFAAACLFTHPDMEETPATREGYFRLHKARIHPQRYAAMVAAMQEQKDGQE